MPDGPAGSCPERCWFSPVRRRRSSRCSTRHVHTRRSSTRCGRRASCANVHFAAMGTDYFHAIGPRPRAALLVVVGRRAVLRRLAAVAVRTVVLGGEAGPTVRQPDPSRRRTRRPVRCGRAGPAADSARTPPRPTSSTTARAWELGVGALLAVVLSRRPADMDALRVPAFVVGSLSSLSSRVQSPSLQASRLRPHGSR